MKNKSTKNYQQLISEIRDFSFNPSVACELSLCLLDLQKNYLNYRYNRDKEIDNFSSGIYQLNHRKFSRKYKWIENYILICYIYFSEKSRINNEENVNETNEETKILKEVEELLRNFITEDFSELIRTIYGKDVLQQSEENLDKMLSSTCLFMSYHLPKNNYFKKMKELINKIDSESFQKFGKLREKITLQNKSLCSCFVRSNNKDRDYFVFCGGWDNDDYPNDSDIVKRYSEAEKIINVAANEIFDKHDKTVEWCKRKENMRSYNFRYNDEKYAKLGKIFNHFKSKRAKCINKHFSCCERKVLPYFEDEKNVDLEIYVTFNPCSDCELAIKEFLKENKGSEIKVIYDQEKDIEPHAKDCNLY